MAARAAALTGARARAMWLMTFHSACVRILRREADRFGYPSSFSIYDQADSQRLMALVCRELELDAKFHPPKAMAGPGVEPEERADRLRDRARQRERATGEKALGEAYDEYQRRLVAAGAMDFDDLIMVTVHLLQAFPDVAAEYRSRFRHVLVDEYQDTNHAQYVLVRELAGQATAEPRGRRRRADPAGRAGRRRRRRPVDLRLPRRHDQEHRGVRARLRRRPGDPARAELPVDAEHPGRRQRRRVAQPGPDPEEPVVGRGRRPADHRLRRRQRARRGRLRRRGGRPARRRGRGRPPARWRSSTGPTRSPASSRKSSSGPGCRTRWSAGSGSTSGARSATCWPTCG